MAAATRGTGSAAGDDDDDLLTLAEAMTSDLVLCDFCRGVYQSPVLLPCLHTFCRRCVVTMVTNEGASEGPTGEAKRGTRGEGGGGGGGGRQAATGRSGGKRDRGRVVLRCPTCQANITLAGGPEVSKRVDGNDNTHGDDDDDDNDENTAIDDDHDDRAEEKDQSDDDEEEEGATSDGDTRIGKRQRQRQRQTGTPETPKAVQKTQTSQTGKTALAKPTGTSKQPTPAPIPTTATTSRSLSSRQLKESVAPPTTPPPTTTTMTTKPLSPRQLKAVETTVRQSLPPNPFLDSLARLHRHRNATGRTCAYCRNDNIQVEATSLCLQCQDDVCDACAAAHRKTRVTRGHRVVPFTSISQGLFDHDIRAAEGGVPCPDHPEESSGVTHFCPSCLVAACKLCRQGTHYGHRLIPLVDAATKLWPEVEQIREAFGRSIESLSEYGQFLSRQLADLASSRKRATEEIKLQAKSIISMIEERRDSLCTRVENEYNREVTNIETRIANIRTSQRSTTKSTSLLRHLANLGRPDEQMSLYAHVLTRHKELLASRPEVVKSKLSLEFCPGPLTDTNVGILLGRLDARRIPVDKQEGRKNQSLLSSLMPSTLGPPHLLGSINDVPSISTAYPSGLDTKDNLLAVVDRENRKVKVFDLQTLQLRKEFAGGGGATKGDSKQQRKPPFQKPFDVAILPNGILAVSDPEAGCVSMYEWTGKFVADFKGDLKHPRGVTLNKDGEVVVVDGHLRRVTVHNATTGVMLRSIRPYREDEATGSQLDEGQNEQDTQSNHVDPKQPSRGRTETLNLFPPVLVDPFYVYVTNEGNMVISDAASPNLKIIDPNGMLLAETMDYGTGPDENLHPSGVCVDKYGYVLVADTNNDRVHLGLPDGQMTENALLSPSDGLSHPVSLCLTQQGHLVIGQSGGHIKLYKYLR